MTIALSPQQHSTSPLRSSPLAKPPWPPTKAAKRRSLGAPTSPGTGVSSGPRGLAVPGRAGPSSPTHSSPSTAAAAGSASASPLSRSHPLLGSYPLSLLHARMSSAHAPHSVPSFCLRLRAVGSPRCPPGTPQEVRCPPALDVPFKATYYDLAEGVNTPWVADVDLESWFFGTYGGKLEEAAPSLLSDRGLRRVSLGASPSTPPMPASLSDPTTPLAPPPHYPGYRVPPVGQLQILIRTATSPLKVFVIPYDLRQLPVGGRLLARERTYVSSGTGTPTATGAAGSSPNTSGNSTPPSGPIANGSGESLRYAVQLQFMCVPAPSGEAEEGDAEKERAFYVARTLKVVFAARAPESSDVVRDERADELVPPVTSSRNSLDGHGSSHGRLDDWSRVRKRYFVTRPPGARPSVPGKSAKAKHRPLASVRGFSPSRERPRTPVAVASQRSLLSALDPRGEDEGGERSVSPEGFTPATATGEAGLGSSSTMLGTSIAGVLLAPAPEPAKTVKASRVTGISTAAPSVSTPASSLSSASVANSLVVDHEATATMRPASPRPPSVADNRHRRSSRNERELSERLRAMELR